MKRHKYKFNRIIIHFLRCFIENCLFISGFQRARLFKMIGYKNIGQDVFIGTNVYLDEVNPLGIHIGNNCTLTRGGVYLTHYYDTKNKKWFDGEIFIGENTFVGCNAIFAKPVKVGDDVIIGAGSVVTKDLESGAIYAGVPAKKIGENKE